MSVVTKISVERFLKRKSLFLLEIHKKFYVCHMELIEQEFVPEEK